MAYPGTEAYTHKQGVSTEQARQGETTGQERCVLGSSLVLAVLAGVFLYLTFI